MKDHNFCSEAYRYLNYPRVFKDSDGHFELVLIYNPQPVRGSPIQHKDVLETFKAFGAIPLHLSLPFHLMTAALLEILMNEKHGDFAIETCPSSKGSQTMLIKVGASHRVSITAKELSTSSQWSKQALSDFLRQHRHSNN